MAKTKLAVTNVDTIFNVNGTEDRFLLSDAIFTKLNTGVMLSGYFPANTTGWAQDANDHIVYETDTGKLFYGADGVAVRPAIISPHLSARQRLHTQIFRSRNFIRLS